jgi:putative protease
VAFDATRGLVEVRVKNRFALDDWLEIIHPDGNFDVPICRMESEDGSAVAVAPGSGHTVWLELPERAVGAFVARYVHAPEPSMA